MEIEVRGTRSGYISMITYLDPEDEDNTASETLVSSHLTTRYNNPENRYFYFPP
jgi:hypothetical protein